MELTLKHFLVFIGSSFFCALTFAGIAVKISAAFGVSGKKIFGYGLISALITAIAAFLVTFLSTDPFLIFWLFGLLFMLAGMLHTQFVNRRYLQKQSGVSFRVLLAASVLGLAITSFSVVAFAAMQYFLQQTSFLYYPVLMSGLLFFVPLLVWYSFQAAYAIPEPVYPVWQYPLHHTPAYPAEVVRERMLVVGLELAKKGADVQKTYFRAKVPETMKLGEFIYHFINDYNELHPHTPIEYMDDSFEPASWLFHVRRKWYQRLRVLNPEFSVRENEIIENTIIICERLPVAGQVVNFYKSSYHEG